MTLIGRPGQETFYSIGATAGTPSAGGSVILDQDGVATIQAGWTAPDDYVRATLTLDVSYDPELADPAEATHEIVVSKQFGRPGPAGPFIPLNGHTAIALPVTIGLSPGRVTGLSVALASVPSSSTASLGVYDDANGPQTLLGFSAPFPIVIWANEVSIDVTLQPGTYWLAFVSPVAVSVAVAVVEDGAVRVASPPDELPRMFPRPFNTELASWTLGATIEPL